MDPIKKSKKDHKKEKLIKVSNFDSNFVVNSSILYRIINTVPGIFGGLTPKKCNFTDRRRRCWFYYPSTVPKLVSSS